MHPHPGLLESLLLGELLVLLLMMVFPVVYLGGLIFAAIRCANVCPDKDKTAWMLITILVPLGWVFYLAIGPKKGPEPTAPPVVPPSRVPSVDDVAQSVARDIEGLRRR